MKFLYISPDGYPPVRVDAAMLFAKALTMKGYEIDWVLQSLSECKSSYRTIWSNSKVRVAATDLRDSKIGKLRKRLLAIANEFRALCGVRPGRYAFIQVKDKTVASLLGILAARATGTRFLFSLSFPFPEFFIHRAEAGLVRFRWASRARGELLRFLMYQIIMRFADHVIVQSEKMRTDVVAEGVDPGKLSVLPMGVDMEAIAEHFSRVTSLEESPVPIILYMGTLIKERQLDFLIRVLGMVHARVPDAELIFAGRGQRPDDMPFLQREARRLGLDAAVKFTGFLPMDEIWRLVRSADVCVSPFRPSFILDSASPTKLVEYLALGAPVVANEHPEQSMIIAESGAGLCVPYEEEAFAAALVEILSNPEMANAMGANGRRYAQEHRSYELIACRLDETYRSLCGDMTSR